MWQYEIKDFSSRYFGGCFVVFKSGVPFATERTYKEAIGRIQQNSLFIKTDDGFRPLGHCTQITFK